MPESHAQARHRYRRVAQWTVGALCFAIALGAVFRIAMMGMIHVCVEGPTEYIENATFSFGKTVIASHVNGCFWFRATDDETLSVTTADGERHDLDYIPHEVVGCARVGLARSHEPSFQINWDTIEALTCSAR